MRSDTRAQIETALRCRLDVITHAQPHHNTHYHGVTATGTTLFIKVIDGHPAYYTAEVHAHRHLAAAHIPTPHLVDHGSLHDTRRWLAYEWHDLEPFVPSPDRIRRAGHLLGELHATTSGTHDDQLRQYTDIHELITSKIALIARFDPPLSERIQKISDMIFARPQKADPGSHACLLHGDMGWRNLHVTSDGRIWLVDFEHAAIGHPLLDFAKLWDRELDAPEHRDAFLSGYRQHQPAQTIQHQEIDAVRLWAAAGIVPYARPREDHDFERHAYHILDKLEAGR